MSYRMGGWWTALKVIGVLLLLRLVGFLMGADIHIPILDQALIVILTVLAKVVGWIRFIMTEYVVNRFRAIF